MGICQNCLYIKATAELDYNKRSITLSCPPPTHSHPCKGLAKRRFFPSRETPARPVPAQVPTAPCSPRASQLHVTGTFHPLLLSNTEQGHICLCSLSRKHRASSGSPEASLEQPLPKPELQTTLSPPKTPPMAGVLKARLHQQPHTAASSKSSFTTYLALGFKDLSRTF